MASFGAQPWGTGHFCALLRYFSLMYIKYTTLEMPCIGTKMAASLRPELVLTGPKMNAHIFALAIAAILMGQPPALAEHAMDKHGLVMKHEAGFIVRKGIQDDYTVIFHVMRSPEGMRYSKEHYHLMVVVEKDHKPVTGLQMTSSVRHPDGTTEQKPMMHMGEWYMTLYNLSHEQGRHWITVQFNKSGKQYSAGAYYPETDFSETSR